MALQVVPAVQAVHLDSDAYLVCLSHALSTEKEEVMGLCIGEVSPGVGVTVAGVPRLWRALARGSGPFPLLALGSLSPDSGTAGHQPKPCWGSRAFSWWLGFA